MQASNISFHPSAIETEIYDILNSDPEYAASSDGYTQEAIAAIIKYLNNLRCQWSFITEDYPNGMGGIISISWLENGFVHHIMVKYYYV